MMETVIGLFGKKADDPVLREIFVPLGLDRQARNGADQLADFRSTYGFELRLSKLAALTAEATGSASVLMLSQIMCYRDREMGARGWRGDLPFGIVFDDSPETVEDNIRRPPDGRVDEEFTGFAVWHFDAYSMCVYYSTMENMVLRVRVMAPSVWAEYEPD